MSHPFIPVPHVARVELIYSVNGITAENVFNVKKGSAYSLSDLQALRGVVDAWDAATWKGSRAVGATLVRIRSKALDTTSSALEDYTLPTARPGTVGGGLFPANVTFALKLNTGLAGRSFRGRWYIVGMGPIFVAANPNQIATGSVTTWINGLTALITTLAANGHTLGVVSYRTDKAYRAEGVFTPAIGWSAVNLDVDSMRRRLTGRGI